MASLSERGYQKKFIAVEYVEPGEGGKEALQRTEVVPLIWINDEEGSLCFNWPVTSTAKATKLAREGRPLSADQQVSSHLITKRLGQSSLYKKAEEVLKRTDETGDSELLSSSADDTYRRRKVHPTQKVKDMAPQPILPAGRGAGKLSSSIINPKGLLSKTSRSTKHHTITSTNSLPLIAERSSAPLSTISPSNQQHRNYSQPSQSWKAPNNRKPAPPLEKRKGPVATASTSKNSLKRRSPFPPEITGSKSKKPITRKTLIIAPNKLSQRQKSPSPAADDQAQEEAETTDYDEKESTDDEQEEEDFGIVASDAVSVASGGESSPENGDDEVDEERQHEGVLMNDGEKQYVLDLYEKWVETEVKSHAAEAMMMASFCGEDEAPALPTLDEIGRMQPHEQLAVNLKLTAFDRYYQKHRLGGPKEGFRTASRHPTRLARYQAPNEELAKFSSEDEAAIYEKWIAVFNSKEKLNSIDDFENFNEEIEKQPLVYEKLVLSFRSTHQERDARKQAAKVAALLIGPNLRENLNWCGRGPKSKKAFSGTVLNMLARDIVRSTESFKACADTEVKAGLFNWLRNCKSDKTE